MSKEYIKKILTVESEQLVKWSNSISGSIISFENEIEELRIKLADINRKILEISDQLKEL